MTQQERGSSPGWEGPSLEQQRANFETVYERFVIGEVIRRGDDGTETPILAYELVVDPMDEAERRALVGGFALRAAQAGYKQALGPVVLPEVGFKDTAGTRSLTAVYLFLEQPSSETSS